MQTSSKNILCLTWEEKRDIVARMIPLSDFIQESSYNIFCPFHHDVHKPSAKTFYNDEDGIQKLYCYRCHRLYTSYDYLKLVLEENPIAYLRERFTEKDVMVALSTLEERKIDNDLVNKIHNLSLGKSTVEFIELLYRMV